MAGVMNKSTVLFLVNEELKAVEVAYEEEGKYSHRKIKKTFRTDLKVGDFVLVETTTRYGASIAKVTRTDVQIDFNADEFVGWIFGKVSLKELDDLKALEENAVLLIAEAERRKQKAEMRKTIMENCGEELKALTGQLLEHKPFNPETPDE